MADEKTAFEITRHMEGLRGESTDMDDMVRKFQIYSPEERSQYLIQFDGRLDKSDACSWDEGVREIEAHRFRRKLGELHERMLKVNR